MKTAIQWQADLKGPVTAADIERIQADALVEAMRVINTDGPRAVERIADLVMTTMTRRPPLRSQERPA